MAGPPIVSGEHIVYHQTLPYDTEAESEYLLFFVTGNPGLIGYYELFLSTLSSLLSSPSSKTRFYIFGSSLSGFYTHPQANPRGPYGLQDQIDQTEGVLALAHTQVTEYKRTHPGTRQNPLNIILIGHSVGSYIALELIRGNRLMDPSSHLRITGAVLLFPTVTHIAKSPSGVKLTMLCRIPHFPWIVGFLTKVLVFLLATPLLHRLVKLVAGMPDQATRTTVMFLQSRMGVWQALHMARDEMKMITEDEWDHEIWGSAFEPFEEGKVAPKQNLIGADPKLLFYFAKEDHWVADRTRDDLIKSRDLHPIKPGSGLSAWKNQVLIDQDNVPHGFCIDHSELVAEKVKTWVKQIVTFQEGETLHK